MQFTARVAAAAATAGVGFLVEFPEDLGSTTQGTPASLWQLDDFRAVQGMTRGAFFQYAVAPVPFSKPTGLLTNLELLIQDHRFHAGWPTFDTKPWH